MKGKIVIERSFDESSCFAKMLKDGDFEEFFQEEGAYLDRLVRIAKEKGKKGDKFEVTYTVTAEL